MSFAAAADRTGCGVSCRATDDRREGRWTRASYRAMARQAGAAVTSFRVRHQFADGDLVCSIVDWTMQPVPGTLSAAEILEIRDGRIVRGELFYDAEELRKAMAGGTSG